MARIVLDNGLIEGLSLTMTLLHPTRGFLSNLQFDGVEGKRKSSYGNIPATEPTLAIVPSRKVGPRYGLISLPFVYRDDGWERYLARARREDGVVVLERKLGRGVRSTSWSQASPSLPLLVSYPRN